MPKAEFASSNPRALIRRARLSDATQIGRLLYQLGYPVSARFVHRKLTVLLNDEKEDLLVAERDDTRVIGFLAMHCIPQIGVEGGFARISYLCVDKETRLKGVGKKLEREACRLAAERGCDRIELHCHARRTEAHGFYARQGYTESPKYFVKSAGYYASRGHPPRRIARHTAPHFRDRRRAHRRTPAQQRNRIAGLRAKIEQEPRQGDAHMAFRAERASQPAHYVTRGDLRGMHYIPHDSLQGFLSFNAPSEEGDGTGNVFHGDSREWLGAFVLRQIER